MTVTDIERYGIDPKCPCEGRAGHTHQQMVRCAPCPNCGARIKGIYFIEHKFACEPGGKTECVVNQ